MRRKFLAVAMAGALAVGMAACGGSGSASGKSEEAKSSAGSAVSAAESAAESAASAAKSEAAASETAEDSGEKAEVSGEGASITIFNSKMEIQSQMEEMAKKYSEEKGVNVEVYYSSDTVAAHLSTRYASNEPYTISMVDAKDIYSLAADHAIDLSDQDWVKDTTQAISIDGKVYGFPVCVEARGIIYNADAIKDGSIKLIEDEKFNQMMDTFDVLKNNNYAKASAISAEREVTEQKLAEGEIAFMFGGNWDWSVLNAFDYTENMGMMPVPNNADDGSSDKLVGGGSKYFFIDSSENTTDAERQAAKDFLNWLVYDDAGQEFLVTECALVPAYSNIKKEVVDPLGKSVKAYSDAGALIPNYNYLPDDHYAQCGAIFQQYLADQLDREGFADQITAYWATAEVGEH